jgi:hypothetical protein
VGDQDTGDWIEEARRSRREGGPRPRGQTRV